MGLALQAQRQIRAGALHCFLVAAYIKNDIPGQGVNCSGPFFMFPSASLGYCGLASLLCL